MTQHTAPSTPDTGAVKDSQAVDPAQAMLAGMGGMSGMVYTALTVVVFVVANAVFTLPVALGVAFGAALAITAWRRYRGEALLSASGSLISVTAAGVIVAVTGSATDFFVIGIWAAAAGAVITLVSLLMRRPLTGVIWNSVHGGKYQWRADGPTLRAHDLATLTFTVMFAARFVVKEWLYLADSTGWLAFAKIAMGTPLTVIGVVVAVWAFRRSTKRLIKAHQPVADAPIG